MCGVVSMARVLIGVDLESSVRSIRDASPREADASRGSFVDYDTGKLIRGIVSSTYLGTYGAMDSLPVMCRHVDSLVPRYSGSRF